MKLVTYRREGTERLGLLKGDYVVDLERAGEKAGSTIPSDMISFLTSTDETWQAAAEIDHSFDVGSSQLIGVVFPLGSVRLAPPVPNPSKIICAGLNYLDHCREQNVPIPERPVFFSKFPSALIGPGEPIRWHPDATTQVDYEAELAFVIRKKAYRVHREEAYDCIAGYTIVNDVSARDAQFADRQWTRSKSFDTFCPMGPCLVTTDEIPDPHHLAIRCWVNGEIRQDSNTGQMIFDIPFLLEYLTRSSTLLPGDIISTGTPDGVGVFRNPKVFLQPGDRVDIEIDGIGRLMNTVA